MPGPLNLSNSEASRRTDLSSTDLEALVKVGDISLSGRLDGKILEGAQPSSEESSLLAHPKESVKNVSKNTHLLSSSLDMKSAAAKRQFIEGCKSGNLELVEDFIEKGFAIDRIEAFNHFEDSIERGHIHLLKLFLQRVGSADVKQYLSSLILCAAHNGSLESIKVLLSFGVDINYQGGPSKESALQYAASRGNLKLVSALIDLGADVNAVSTNGYSSLTAAIHLKFEGIARLLIENGAKVDVPYPATATSGGARVTSFQMLIYNELDDLAELAIEKGYNSTEADVAFAQKFREGISEESSIPLGSFSDKSSGRRDYKLNHRMDDFESSLADQI